MSPAVRQAGPVPLRTLQPGQSFVTASGRRGVLLYVNECRARVRYGEPTKRSITRSRPGLTESGERLTVTYDVQAPPAELDIAPGTMVVLVGAEYTSEAVR